MKQVIINSVNFKEYRGTKSPVLLSMIYDDLIQLLRFIYKAQAEGALKGLFSFTSQIEYLDSFWHHFILHTRLYHEFCNTELGGYLHHEPEQFGPSDSEVPQNSAHIFSEQLEMLEKNMGRDFVQRIFFIYPELLK